MFQTVRTKRASDYWATGYMQPPVYSGSWLLLWEMVSIWREPLGQTKFETWKENNEGYSDWLCCYVSFWLTGNMLCFDFEMTSRYVFDWPCSEWTGYCVDILIVDDV